MSHHDRAIPLPGLDECRTTLTLDGHRLEGRDDSRERYMWAHQRVICDLLASGEQRREPMASARAATTSLEMIMAVYESHFSARRVAIPLAIREHPFECIARDAVRKGVRLSAWATHKQASEMAWFRHL